MIEITKLKKGTPVNYHSLIGGPVTKVTRIKEEPYKCSSGEIVCFVEDVRGCVSVRALSFPEEKSTSDNIDCVN